MERHWLWGGWGKFYSGLIHLWDIAEKKKTAVFHTSDCVKSVAFSPDGKVLFAQEDGDTLLSWNVAEKKVIAMKGIPKAGTLFALSPDRSLFAYGRGEGTVHLWGVAIKFKNNDFTNSTSRRVLRGGSWCSTTYGLRCADHAHREPTYTSFDLGFRCAKDF